jgi:amino acid transporter
MVKPPTGLSRKSMGGGALWVFGVGASSPMTVMAGGVIATYATTGVVGVPLSFLVIAVALLVLTVGYVAMARHVPHAATAYALLSHGLGRAWGTAAAAVALLAYNAMNISLYGLLGATVAGLAGGPWWAWAAVVWSAVAWLGVRRVAVNARLLTVSLVAELLVIGLLDVAGFMSPASGAVDLASLSPQRLFVNGVGGVFALSVAAFVGYESGPVFAEEARGDRTASRATFAALAFLGLFYALSSWAMASAVGSNSIVDAARDPASRLPFSLFASYYGGFVAWLATALLITSIFAAMLSFHNSVARYVFALGRESLLPQWLARIGSGPRGGAPVGGSVLQSLVAAAVIATAVLAGVDPVTVVFTWLSTVGAIGVLALLVGSSLAALLYFRAGGGTNEGVWTRAVAPALGVLIGSAVLVVCVANVRSLLGVAVGSSVTVLVPGSVGLAIIAGLAWGLRLRRSRPEVYAGIGRGRPHPLAQLDARLAELDV